MSHNSEAAELTNSFLAGPVHLLLRVVWLVILALVIRFLLHRVINRLTEGAAYSFRADFRNSVRARSRLLRGHLRRRATAMVAQRRAATETSTAATSTAEAGPAEAGPAEAGPSETSPSETSTAGTGTGSAEDSAAETADDRGATSDATADIAHALVDERHHQRIRALGSVLRSAASIVIFAIAGAQVLSYLGIALEPLVASAGVAGVALGFGAQNLVRDYLSGVFMLLEDQYGVGDIITVGNATGTVENVTLRVTRIRDTKGVVWHVRNGSVEVVGNESQGWARAVIDYPVPYEADMSTISEVLSEAAEAMWQEPQWRAHMLGAPEVWGAQEVTSAVVTMRIVVKTAPLRQWPVEREMRARLHAALDAAGIGFPPQVVEWAPPPSAPPDQPSRRPPDPLQG
jgi:small conductance mechanosensitive channel